MTHKLIEDKTKVAQQLTWAHWVVIYIVLVCIGTLSSAYAYGLVFYLFNGGVILAALLSLSGKAAGQRRYFLALVFFIDATLKVTLAEQSVLTAGFTSVSLLLQGVLGAWLIKRYEPSAINPNTLKKITAFFLWGALLPVCFSATAGAIYESVTSPAGNILAMFASTWLWWFINRLASLVLVAPLLLLIAHTTPEKIRRYYNQSTAEFWWSLVLACAITAVIFSEKSYPGQMLATYSYLIIPVMLLIAIRQPLIKALVIMLAVVSTSYWLDAHTAETRPDALHSLLALSVFLLITCLVVWLLGSLNWERQAALRKEKRQHQLYQILSRVNQLLARNEKAPAQLFEQLSRTILLDGGYQKVCIKPIAASDLSVSESVCAAQLNNNGESGSEAEFSIRKNGKCVAALQLWSSEPQHFDNETSIFLDELTSDIGFALEVYDKERKLEQIGAVFRHSRESIIITEPDGTILDVNPAFTTITGFKREEVLGKNPRILKSGIQERPFYRQIFAQLMKEGYWAGEFWNMRKNGDIYPQRGTISAVRNEQGEIRYFMGVMEDISDHINSENEIQRLVHYDVLTSLPNRVLLRKEFNKIAGTVTEKSPWALFFVDLDHFKHVNDALGHHFGDELLKIVSQRLRNEVTDTDVLCRFGGDEFIVLLKANKDHAAQCAKKMINKVIQPYAIQDQCIHIGCSIGIALMPEHGQTLDELIQAADTAMYEAKAQGRSRFVFYLPEMKNNAQARLKLRTELKQAINESQLYLVYQPKVRITDGGTELFGLEALVRWRQPERGLIMPSEFIPAAEESGQILEIDRWILTRAIKQLALWHGRDNVQSVPLAVNVSAQMFAHNQFIPLLKRELLQSGVPGRLLELEITEYVAMFDIEHTLKTLNGLKELGIQISIDDFGTGHSSLAYLQEFPIDNVKIDISFVREVHNCVKKQGLIRAILSMSNTLGIAVIAEGVEQKEEFEFLKSIGCVQFQGFYFGKPVPGEDVELRK